MSNITTHLLLWLQDRSTLAIKRVSIPREVSDGTVISMGDGTEVCVEWSTCVSGAVSAVCTPVNFVVETDTDVDVLRSRGWMMMEDISRRPVSEVVVRALSSDGEPEKRVDSR